MISKLLINNLLISDLNIFGPPIGELLIFGPPIGDLLICKKLISMLLISKLLISQLMITEYQYSKNFWGKYLNVTLFNHPRKVLKLHFNFQEINSLKFKRRIINYLREKIALNTGRKHNVATQGYQGRLSQHWVWFALMIYTLSFL